MKDIPVARGRRYLLEMIARGEHENQDFKYSIGDACKIARSISAFANRGGGHLLIGVKDNGVVAGVRNEEDIYVVEQAAEMYCEPPQKIRVTAFKTEGGHTVMRVEIDRAEKRPVHVKESGGELRAYYRVHDENISAPALMVRAWEQASANEGTLVEVSRSGRMLLEMAEEHDGTTLESFMLSAHVSRQTAEDIALNLYSMGLIDFVYNGTCFMLRSK